MSSLLSLIKRVYNVIYLPAVEPSPDSPPIKFGILGAANIAPPALISPAKNHPEAVVYAVAARDLSRAQEFAKKYSIEKAYGGPNGYQELLDDPEVEAVYNPLPNGLHFEWTMKALAAGKHVLLEKPSANTAEETRQMFEFAEKKGLVLLEAFHYRFHPAVQRAKAILNSGELGAIKSIETSLATPAGLVGRDDIRFKHALGGGSLMDMGCYTISSLRYLASSEPTSVLSATTDIAFAKPNDPEKSHLVDRAARATLSFPNDITGSIFCDFRMPPSYGFIPKFPDVNLRVKCEGGELSLSNFVLPTIFHSLVVKKFGKGGKTETRVEKVYSPRDLKEGDRESAGWAGRKGEDYWTTYRYQLEAFIDRLKGRTPQTWVEAEDSIATMKAIEMVYAKNGLGSRPASTFKLPEA